MFGLPEQPCGDYRPHDWHSNGQRFCPGIPDYENAVELAYFSELDAFARAEGIVGDTYPTGLPGYAARRAYVEHEGTLYVSPAMYDGNRWPRPGEQPPRVGGRDRMADQRADQEHDNRLRRIDEHTGLTPPYIRSR